MQFKNASVCLPSGLACYQQNVMLSQDNCSVVPCKGFYADVVKYGAQDLHMDLQIYEEYKKYKAAYDLDSGKKIKLIVKAYYLVQKSKKKQIFT